MGYRLPRGKSVLGATAACAVFILAAACGRNAPSPPDIAEAEGRARANAGRTAFRACAVCHSVADPATPDGRIRLAGPNLHGIYGAPAGRREGFAYSKALKTSGVIWSETALDAYIESPGDFIRGNRMAYPGEPDSARRAAIIDYLKSQE